MSDEQIIEEARQIIAAFAELADKLRLAYGLIRADSSQADLLEAKSLIGAARAQLEHIETRDRR